MKFYPRKREDSSRKFAKVSEHEMLEIPMLDEENIADFNRGKGRDEY